PSNQESLALSVGAPAAVVTNYPSTDSTPYPEFSDICSATGFANIPRNVDENNGVTFVLDGKASFCFSADCTSASPQPVVMLSPYCSTLSNNDFGPSVACPYATAGTYMNDGAFTIYGTSQGTIEAAGSSAILALTRTVFLPHAFLNITANAQFEIIPGQAILYKVYIQSGNTGNPTVYFDDQNAALLPPSV